MSPVTCRQFIVISTFVAALPVTAWATKGFGLIENNTLSSGMHGGATALIDDAAAARINPANLSFIGATSLAATVTVYDVTSHFTAPGGLSMSSEKPWKPAGSFFVATPMSPRLTIGFGLDTPYGTSMRWPKQGLFKYTLPYQGDLKMPDLVTSVGIKLSDSVRLGLELDTFRASLNLKQFYPWFAVTGNPATPDGDMEFDGRDTCFSGGLGVTWTPLPGHRVALVAHTQTAIHFGGSFTITNIPAPIPGITPRSDFAATLRMPADFTLSYAWDVTGSITLGIEAEYIGNSAVDRLAADVGSNNVLFPSTVTPLNWRNTGAFSLGYRQHLTSSLTLLAGYQYTDTPMNQANYTPLVPGNNRQLFSAGLAYDAGHLSIHLSYNYGIHPDLHVSGNVVPAFNGTHTFDTNVFTTSIGWRF